MKKKKLYNVMLSKYSNISKSNSSVNRHYMFQHITSGRTRGGSGGPAISARRRRPTGPPSNDLLEYYAFCLQFIMKKNLQIINIQSK